MRKFEPKIYFQLTKEEIVKLTTCAQCHYDYACKQTAMVGGFLYGAGNNDGKFSVTFRQLDLLCKIVEIPPPHIDLRDVARFLHYMAKISPELTPMLKGDIEYAG